MIEDKPEDNPENKPDVVEVEPGVYSILLNGRSYEARADGDVISIDGHRIRVEIQDPRRWNPAKSRWKSEGESIKAPMPGKIVRVLVKIGDDVTAGQGLVVIEAMKMQNELKWPRAGNVTAINIKENDAVIAGTVLAMIE
ncbi:MAG: biotin/lipoyl-binding protein [Acidobacteriota bacterium]|nr:biotin/lipoyl-binding protein [Acidobacteriota bacterium]